MKAGSKMTGALLGTCLKMDRMAGLGTDAGAEIAYASKMWFLVFFCVAKHAKRPKRWPPAVCFTVVQCSLAFDGSEAARADDHSVRSEHTVPSARLSLLYS